MNEKIAILCDSACDLPPDIINELSISIMPLKVIYGEKIFSDRVDIQPEEVYAKMPAEIPTTSMPTPDDIRSAFDRLARAGYTHLVSIHLSSALSGTYQAVSMVAKEYHDLTIEVVDTKTLSMGTGWIVYQAAENVRSGLSFEQVLSNIKDLQSKMNLFYVLETLEYLRRGGRIGMVSGMIGEFLHLKPVISVNDQGEYYTFAKVRGRQKSIDRIIRLVKEIALNHPINLAIMHGGAPKEAEKIMDVLKSDRSLQLNKTFVAQISPSLGVHTGPGLLGVCFYPL